MADVIIRKHNNVYIQVEAEPSIRMGMSEHFARFVKGYQFQPKYKARIWDGKIRFFQYQNGMIYAGLINRLLDYCKENQLSVNIDPEVKELFKGDSEEQVNEYVNGLVMSAHGKRIEFRDYQKKAIAVCMTQKRKLIQSPTSSGKSSIIYGICRYLLDNVLEKGERILVIVPTIGLVTQLKSDFADYSSLNGWDADANMVLSTESKGKRNEKAPIFVQTWQSCFKLPEEYFSQFRAIITDEVHQAAANSLVSIGKKCNAEFRIGLSGSINEEDEATDMTLTGIYGTKYTTVTTKQLMDEGTVAKLKVNCIQLKYEKNDFSGSYQKELEYIVQNNDRNRLIMDMANELEGNVLILFGLVEKHGKPLKELSKKYQKELFFVYGGTDVDDREKIRKLAETHKKGCIILASYQTFSTGVNIRNIRHIIFASPTKSFSRVIQSIGRGLRTSLTKTHCDVYDLFDEIRGDYKDPSSFNYTFKHFLERVKIYVKEGFEYSVNKVDIKVNHE